MQELAMSTEVWAIISAVIVILVAIATSHRALRQEMNERFREVHERIDGLAERVTDLRAEMIERFGTVEGLLEGIGHVLRKRTGKERRDTEHGPAHPQP